MRSQVDCLPGEPCGALPSLPAIQKGAFRTESREPIIHKSKRSASPTYPVKSTYGYSNGDGSYVVRSQVDCLPGEPCGALPSLPSVPKGAFRTESRKPIIHSHWSASTWHPWEQPPQPTTSGSTSMAATPLIASKSIEVGGAECVKLVLICNMMLELNGVLWQVPLWGWKIQEIEHLEPSKLSVNKYIFYFTTTLLWCWCPR